MEFNYDLSGLFVEADNFDYKDTNESAQIFKSINTNNARFYLSPQINPPKNVICKVYDPSKFVNDEYSTGKSESSWYLQLKLLRESIFLKNLSHPTIVKFVGVNLYNGCFKPKNIEGFETYPTLFLEFLENKSIQQNIKNFKLDDKDFTPVRRQIIMTGIVAAVRFLHHNRVTHRSLSPKTIWLDEKYYPRVFDFSKSRESIETDQQATLMNADDIQYQAPEIILYQSYDDKIDIFSLGRLIYLLVTGYEPFKYPRDENETKKSYSLQREITSKHALPKFPENLSSDFKNLLISCWSLNPNDRPSADQIYDWITHDPEFLINGVDDSDLPEILEYVHMLQQYETTNNIEIPIVKTFEWEDKPEIPSDEKLQIDKLKNFIRNDDVENNEDEFFSLILAMANNESIFKEDYLLQVMKYVDRYYSRNNFSAKEFIEKLFGKRNLPKNIKEITQGTVDENVEFINIPPSVRKICASAFSNLQELKRVYIPDSVTIIEEMAFSGCKKLTFVRIPDTIVKGNIGKAAFKGCTSLNNVSIPSKLTIINEEMFYGDINLSNVVLNNVLDTISASAFCNCESLKNINIPDSVTSIQKNAFKQCKNLKTVQFKHLKQNKIKYLKMGHKYP